MEHMVARMSELMDTILQVRYTDVEKEGLCCQELLNLAQEQGSTYAKAFAFTYMVDYCLAKSDAAKCENYLFKAREICTCQSYPDLYLKLCHLSGFYYHMVYDEQNALQYYLETLKLAQETGDVSQRCNTWNNIADMFQQHGHFEEALRYYLRAYKVLTENKCDDRRVCLMLQFNLAEICCILGELEKAEHYVLLSEAMPPTDPMEQLFYYLCCLSSRCTLAAAKNDREQTVALAQEILERKLCDSEDKYTVIEFAMPIGNALVAMGEAELALKYISLLEKCCTINETQFMKRLVELRTSYAEAFSNEDDLIKTYRDYCYTMRKIQKAENAVRASGMNAKIHLYEVMRQQETTLLENKRLEDVVNLDELTGIYNRRFFNRKMEEVRQGLVADAVGIVMVDVDYFKQYNDTYSHIKGDMVLKQVSMALHDCAGEKIFACRYGGDEFSCFCIGLTDEEIEEYIKRVCAYLNEIAIPHTASLCAGQVTLSIGYSSDASHCHMNAGAVLAQADQALYEAKTAGRNAWRRYDRCQ